MTDKEFKRLSRSQLIDIIYQLQLELEEVTKENTNLKDALEDKRFRMHKAGNIAEASLEINNVMKAAQDAADQYLAEIRRVYSELEEKRQRILSKAHEEADMIIAQAKRVRDTDGYGYPFGPDGYGEDR